MLIYLFHFAISNRSAAAPLCPGQLSQMTAPSAVSKFLLNVNQIGPADRQTAADFAHDEPGQPKASVIEARYAATGDMRCGSNEFGQGQVVIDHETVVASAHTWQPTETCPLPETSRLDDCTFTLKVAGKNQAYKLERVVATGYKCPYEGKRFPPTSDWIIFKLKKAVDRSVKPYQIPDDPEEGQRTKDLVQVAKSNDFNPTNKSLMKDVVRHYGRCQRQFSYPSGLLETDCDASPASSGGSVLTPGENPKLIAIVKGGSITPCPDGTGKGKIGAYQKGCWATYATPVKGEFYDALATLNSQSQPGNGSTPRLIPPIPPRDTDFKDL